MSLPRRYKAGAYLDIPAQPCGWTFLLHCLHCILDGTFFICNVLLSGGGGNGRNRTDCELAKRCNTLPHLWVSVWHQIGSCTSQGNRGEERCHWDLPCQQWPLGGSFWGSGLFSRESGSSPMGPELLWPPLASVFPKVPLAQAPWRQLGPNQKGERGPVRAGPPVGWKTTGCLSWRRLPCR